MLSPMLSNFISGSYSRLERLPILLKLFFFTLLFLFSSSVQTAKSSSYHFSADDQISIDIFGEPDLSRSKIRIATDGTISLPLIGQIQIQGLTAIEIEKKLTRLLADGFLKKPIVNISIVEYRQFYINGEVNKPGGYSFRDGLTIERAVAIAGGFSERASKNKINIAHEKNTGQVDKAELTTSVEPGDIITVGESFF